MFVMLRLLIPLLVVLTIVYAAVSLYSRWMRRRKLAAFWDKKSRTGDRDAFIERGLKAYDRSFRRKLILGVYIVPLGLIALLVYFSNFM